MLKENRRITISEITKLRYFLVTPISNTIPLNMLDLFSITSTENIDVLKNLSKIYDGAFCENIWQLKSVNYL